MTPKKIQDEIFYLIDGIYQNDIKLEENFKIELKSSKVSNANGLKLYSVNINQIKFKVSESMGMWGVEVPDDKIRIEDIFELVKAEIREQKINNILNE